MKTLLLKFAGPMQSWGTGSHFETRHTDMYPSKSGVIGLIAASLGYRRNQDEKINSLNALDFGVRVDRPGKLLRDYHIATKYKSNGTFDRNYVTNRYYLEDAVFTVALGSENEALVEEIAHAVKRPYFQTYLGRRSLPLTYDFYQGVFEAGVIETLTRAPLQGTKSKNTAGEQEASYMIYADAKLLPDGIEQSRKDHVVSFDQKERRFAYREEKRQKVFLKRDETPREHDAFGVIGD